MTVKEANLLVRSCDQSLGRERVREEQRGKSGVAERRQNTEWHRHALLMHSTCHRIQQQGEISHKSLHKICPTTTSAITDTSTHTLPDTHRSAHMHK